MSLPIKASALRTARDKCDVSTGRKKKRPPYASIAPTLLATQKVRKLSSTALRVFLWANACWNPNAPLLLPSERTSEELGIERKTLAAAKKELIGAGLLLQTRDPIRPGAAGSGSGKTAAEFDLPSRHKEAVVAFDVGDQKLEGYWRINCENLRDLVKALDGAALRVLCCIVIPQHRRTNGSLAWSPPEWAPGDVAAPVSKGSEKAREQLEITTKRLVDVLGISRRAAQYALDALEFHGLVRLLRSSKGSAPAIYVPHGLTADRRTDKQVTFQPYDTRKTAGAPGPETPRV